MTLLAEVAAEGAFVRLPEAAGSGQHACRVLAPRAGEAGPVEVAQASRAAVAHALRKGWVEPDGKAGLLTLTGAGREALAAEQGKAARRRGRPPVQKETRAAAQRAEGPLAWLRRRKDRLGKPFMSETEISAAERLASDFWHGGMSPRVTANWSAAAPRDRMRRATPGIGVEISDAVLAARQRFYAALDSVGTELSRILVLVCCQEAGLEEIEQAAGWPQRTARIVLGMALKELARHYGMIAPEPPASTRLRHWGEPDYRPTLAAWAD